MIEKNNLLEHEDSDWMLSNKLNFLMQSAATSAAASLVVIAVLTWQNWSAIQSSGLAQAWVVFAFGVDIVNIVFCWLLRRRPEILPDRIWLRLYRSIIFAGGLAYGLIAVLFFENASLTMQAFNIFIIIGVPAAAIGTLTVDRLTYSIYLFTITGITVAFFLFSGDSHLMGLAFLIALFAGIMARTSELAGRFIRSNINMAYTMSYRASHDPLVKLYNRVELENQFELLAPESNRAVAMLFVDLDNFKPLNDTLGHQAGDGALIAVADVIKGAIRSDDIAARLGGDEFVVVLFIHEAEEAMAIARQILRGIAGLDFDDRYSGLSASIGIGFHDNSDVSFSGLMRVADLALYKSKVSGKNQVTLYAYGQRPDASFLSAVK